MPISPSSASEWPATDAIILTDLFTLAKHPEKIPWQPFRPGVDIHMLYGDSPAGEAHQRTQGPSAALLNYAPGATVPAHRHTGYEHIVVLSGSQSDHQGQHLAGSLIINPPGSRHDIVSEDGCIVLIIWERPVAMLKETT
ncbi:MAG: cupin domain-containing protein [Cyanobacteria bacterium P01_F01_bin.53]